MVNEEEQPIQWLMKDKNTSNDLQNTTDKTKDWATRASLCVTYSTLIMDSKNYIQFSYT
jgi:hypothetical protein